MIGFHQWQRGILTTGETLGLGRSGARRKDPGLLGACLRTDSEVPTSLGRCRNRVKPPVTRGSTESMGRSEGFTKGFASDTKGSTSDR